MAIHHIGSVENCTDSVEQHEPSTSWRCQNAAHARSKRRLKRPVCIFHKGEKENERKEGSAESQSQRQTRRQIHALANLVAKCIGATVISGHIVEWRLKTGAGTTTWNKKEVRNGSTEFRISYYYTGYWQTNAHRISGRICNTVSGVTVMKSQLLAHCSPKYFWNIFGRTHRNSGRKKLKIPFYGPKYAQKFCAFFSVPVILWPYLFFEPFTSKSLSL